MVTLMLQIPSEKVFRHQKTTPNTVSEGVWSSRVRYSNSIWCNNVLLVKMGLGRWLVYHLPSFHHLPVVIWGKRSTPLFSSTNQWEFGTSMRSSFHIILPLILNIPTFPRRYKTFKHNNHIYVILFHIHIFVANSVTCQLYYMDTHLPVE